MTPLPHNTDFDAVIIGGGPAGAIAAITLADFGRKVLVVEKNAFPRFHIGESLTGECAEVLESIGLGDYMNGAGYPIKHGVTVHGRSPGSKFWVPVQCTDDKGEPQARTTWQVRRKDFDLKLLETAMERGAQVINARASAVIKTGKTITGVEIVDSSGNTETIKSKIMVDASGQNCFLGQNGVLGRMKDADYAKQIAVFAHVKGARLDAAPNHGNTHIFYGKTNFWSWVIPQDDEVTSLGVVVPLQHYKESGLDKEAFFRAMVRDINPELTSRVTDIEIVSPVRTISNYSYAFEKNAGPGFISIGDSAGFLDPIFSFGVTVALKEGQLGGQEIEKYLAHNGDYSFDPFLLNLRKSRRVIQLIIDTFWRYPLAFLRLAHYTHEKDIAELFYGKFYEPKTQHLEAVELMDQLSAKAA